MTVFQVKFATTSVSADAVFDWVMQAAQGEKAKVQRLKERGATKYFFISNVQATSHLDHGSIDKTARALEEMLGLPFSCWWRNDINRRLDGRWDIKLRYPEFSQAKASTDL